jgi:hypothetical protein
MEEEAFLHIEEVAKLHSQAYALKLDNQYETVTDISYQDLTMDNETNSADNYTRNEDFTTELPIKPDDSFPSEFSDDGQTPSSSYFE